VICTLQINGSVCALRLALLKLPLLSSEGWKCVVAKTTPARGLFSVVITPPRADAEVHVSVGAFVQALVAGEDSQEMTLDATQAAVHSVINPTAVVSSIVPASCAHPTLDIYLVHRAAVQVSEDVKESAVAALIRRLSA
jgi:hypothetical protein